MPLRYWQILVLNLTLPATSLVLFRYFVVEAFADGAEYVRLQIEIPCGGKNAL